MKNWQNKLLQQKRYNFVEICLQHVALSNNCICIQCIKKRICVNSGGALSLVVYRGHKELIMKEHKNVITFLGNPMTLLGESVVVGQTAPDFKALANNMSPKSLADYPEKTIVISVVPSLDTGVCDLQTRRFNSEATALGNHVQILTISCDLPFAQARWCGAAGVNQLETLSDHYDLSFGYAYGVAIKELRLLARAIFIVGKDRKITYTEIVPEVTSEVNFEAALAAAKKA